MKIYSSLKSTLFYFLLLLVCTNGIAQSKNTLKVLENSKAGDKYVRCMKTDGTLGDLEKVISNLSEKDILKIQQRLQFLKFNVSETGIYDTQTQKAFELFDAQNGIKNLAMEGILTAQMKSRLFEAYRKERKKRRKATKA